MSGIKSIAVYLGATMPSNPAYVAAVRELGEKLARQGKTLVFGGSREGTMTVIADAVLRNGGKVVGVFTKALPPEYLYQGMTETFVTENLGERKEKMLALADAVIALPGSYGTWDELFDALEQTKINMMQGRPSKPIGILNVNGFFNGLVEFIQNSVHEGFTTRKYSELLKCADTVDELLRMLEN